MCWGEVRDGERETMKRKKRAAESRREGERAMGLEQVSGTIENDEERVRGKEQEQEQEREREREQEQEQYLQWQQDWAS